MNKLDEYLTNNPDGSRKSGYVDIPNSKIYGCTDINHNPPSHIYVPQGEMYIHYCPSCGHKSVIYPTVVYC